MGRDIRPRIHNVNTQSDVINLVLGILDGIVDKSNYEFIDIGEGQGFVTKKVKGYKLVKGYEMLNGTDFFSDPVSQKKSIYYMFNPFSESDTLKMNTHMAKAKGYLVYYDAQWSDVLDPLVFKEIFSRLIVGGWLKVYQIL